MCNENWIEIVCLSRERRKFSRLIHLESSLLFELALVPVRFDHVASFVVDATSEAVQQQRLPGEV